jgi:hypothetical protein
LFSVMKHILYIHAINQLYCSEKNS